MTMAGICAGCMRPIERGDDFVLAGPECFHKRCVAAIAESYGTRMKQSLLRLRTELEKERGEVSRLERALVECKREFHRIEADIKPRIEALERQKTQIDNLRDINADARRRAEEFKAERDRLQDELGATMRHLVTVQNEVAMLRSQMSGKSTDEDQETDKDPTSVRFGLLELD